MSASNWHTGADTSIVCRCIKSKQYFLARKLLQQDIFCLGDTGLNAADYLLYCYYSALVCIAVKDSYSGTDDCSSSQ